MVAHQRHAAGSARNLRAEFAAFLLNTRDANIKTIKHFKDSDRIAVPAVKSSVQAITLQMAAAKTYGTKEFNKLNALTVSMTPPDATVALLKGGAQISAAFSVPPFQYQQLEDPAVHTVLNSFDVMGGSHTFTAVWAPAKFRNGNPVLYKAMAEVGTLKAKPESWKDYFFPEIHGEKGS